MFALSRLGWPVLPGERGAGREPVRVSAGHVWRLPDGARRAGYARIITVVPQTLASSSSLLLSAIGVRALEDAPLTRLFAAVGDLASRLEDERLQTRPDAVSFANELYGQIERRLESEAPPEVPPDVSLVLLRDLRLRPWTPLIQT